MVRGQQKKRLKDVDISSSEAAEILGCSAKTVTRLVDAGSISGWRITDRGWNRISRSSVIAYRDARMARGRDRERRRAR
ncbi:helix-turn-helix domain-containing protein [Candidatus Korobacter versatilis]|uniref:helix-turn-helix domain-containing protein n=1 Tax=Candidatus Korobacter versatilis TaxID=658062 RepID=UPI0038CBF5AF